MAYDALREALQAFVTAHGEDASFIGQRALQVDAALAPLPGVEAVTDFASALRALDTIVTRSEGAGEEQAVLRPPACRRAGFSAAGA